MSAAGKTRVEKAKPAASTRDASRFSNLRDISVVYDGNSEMIAVRTPDISPRGMFINTPVIFPEGAVLKVRFRLTRSNYLVQARCEVRYCLPGVGVGVEFINITRRDEKAIREEVLASTKARPRRKRRK